MKFWPPKKYVTARAVIVRDGKLLVFHRKRYDRRGNWIEYYSIPGGKLEKRESPETAVVRELHEEMGVDIALIGLIAHYENTWFEHHVYAAKLLKGEPQLMTDSEEAQQHSAENQFTVTWIDVTHLSPDNLKFYGMFYLHIMALAAGKDVAEIAAMPVPDHVY